MIIKTAIYIMGAIFAAASCTGERAEPPQVSQVVEDDLEVNAELGKGQVILSRANTEVAFTGAKMVGSHEGVFKELSGSLHYDGPNPSKARVSVSIDTSSVTTDNEQLDGHLKSADFFDVEKFPRATFESTSIKRKAGDMYTVTGDFTLHGIKRTITFDALIRLDGDSLSTSARFEIDRKDYGIVYPGMPDNLIRDAVEIRLRIDAGLTVRK